MDFDIFDFAETIPAGGASLVDLREYFALITGSGLQLRVKGHNGRGIGIPLNFVFGDGNAPMGRAEIVNPTGAPVAFRLITSSVGFNASALSSTQNVAIVACAITLPVSGNFGGLDADGAVRTANPIGTAGYDGANMRALKVDTSGRPMITGAAAAGAAIAGNPVMVGGSDGANARAMSTDATGRPIVVGAAATGAAVAGNPLLAGGSDGVNAQALKVDTSGRQLVAGAVASGTAVTGNPVLIGGNDGTNVQSLTTTGQGILRVGIEATVGAVGQTLSRLRSAATTNPVSVKASAAKLYSVVVSNTNAAARFLKLYNKASAPTVGTDTPAQTILVPPGATVSLQYLPAQTYGTGLAFATTVGEADTDVAAVGAGDLHILLGYI